LAQSPGRQWDVRYDRDKVPSIVAISGKILLAKEFSLLSQVSRRFGAFLSPEMPKRRKESGAKKAWLNAYTGSMRRKTEMIGKLQRKK
jgi:hypothetical protein